MAKQISSSPSNKKISELYKRVNEGTLILQPEFQRKLVWTLAHKIDFLETVLLGLPFPEIYVAQSGVDIDKIDTVEVIVDGQQRLSTIFQYIDKQLDPLIEKHGNKIPQFINLSDEDKKNFINYNVVVRDLEDISPDQIKEIFKRINLTKFSLEQIEIQHAIYDGEFILTAKTILTTIGDDSIPLFSESELSRMADLHFILSIMSTIVYKGYFVRDKEIENMIVEYNDFFAFKEEIESKLIEIFKIIKEINLPVDSMWYRKSNFFTLIVELYNNLDSLNIEKIQSQLNSFEELVMSNKSKSSTENTFAEYYSYMFSGTNSRKARVKRGEILINFLLEN